MQRIPYILENFPFSGGKVKQLSLEFGTTWMDGGQTASSAQGTSSTGRTTSTTTTPSKAAKSMPGLSEAMDHAWSLAVAGIVLEVPRLVHAYAWNPGNAETTISETLASFGSPDLTLAGIFEFNVQVSQEALISVIRSNVLSPLLQASGYYSLQNIPSTDEASSLLELITQPIRSLAQHAPGPIRHMFDLSESPSAPRRRETVKR